MNAFQQALRQYFETSTAQATYAVDGNTRTLAEWRALGNATLLLQVANDAAFGGTLGLTVGQTSVPSADVRAAIYSAPDIVQLSGAGPQLLAGALGSDPFNFGNSDAVAGVENILTSFLGSGSTALARFRELTLKGASIAQHVADTLGLPDAESVSASMDDINATL